MDTERLQVKVGMGLHLQLFIDATVDILKRGEELDGLCEEYVSNLSLIKRLAQECIPRLQSGDPWRYVFEIIEKQVIEVYDTMFQVPVLNHTHALEFLASTYNRCKGIKYWHDFLLGDGIEKRIIRTVDMEPLSDPEIRSKLNELLAAIRRQVEYANNVKARFKR